MILYSYINRHAGTPSKTKAKYTISLDYSSICYIGSRIGWVSVNTFISPYKITLNGDPALRRRLLDIVVRIWKGGEVPQQCKDAIIMVLHKNKDRIECGTTGASRL